MTYLLVVIVFNLTQVLVHLFKKSNIDFNYQHRYNLTILTMGAFAVAKAGVLILFIRELGQYLIKKSLTGLTSQISRETIGKLSLI